MSAPDHQKLKTLITPEHSAEILRIAKILAKKRRVHKDEWESLYIYLMVEYYPSLARCPDIKFCTWAYHICKWKSIDYVRKHGCCAIRVPREPHLDPPDRAKIKVLSGPTIDDHLESISFVYDYDRAIDTTQIIEHLLETLTDQEAAVYQHIVIKGKSSRDFGVLYSLTESRVSQVWLSIVNKAKQLGVIYKTSTD